MPGMDLGIDLGTSQVVIYASGKGVVLKEPAVIAVDSRDGHIVACGQEAYDMLGRTPSAGQGRHRGLRLRRADAALLCAQGLRL